MHQKRDDRIIRMEKPYIICFQGKRGGIEVHVHMQKGWDFRVWGIVVADITDRADTRAVIERYGRWA